MKSFPLELGVENVQKFSEIKYENDLFTLRKQIFDHLIENSPNKEDNFFDLDKFNRIVVKNVQTTYRMTRQVQEELEKLGWKTWIGFGDTGLYIYSTS